MADNEIGVAVMCAAMGYDAPRNARATACSQRALVEALSATRDVPYNRLDGKQYIHHLQAPRLRPRHGGKQGETAPAPAHALDDGAVRPV